MDFKDNRMIIEKLDLDYFLTAYLRSYLFYNKGKPPEEVTIPMIPGFVNPRDPKKEPIPVRFVDYTPEPVTPQEALELPSKVEEVEDKEEQKDVTTGRVRAPRNRAAS